MPSAFYDFAGGLVQRDDSRLLKPGDLTSAVGGEMRPGSNSIFTTGIRKAAGVLGGGEHVPGLMFAQHDAVGASRIVAGVGTGLFESVPSTTAIASTPITIDGATLAYASTPKALVGKQTAEKLFVASGVGVNVTIDGSAFAPRRQNLFRKADGTWLLLSMIAPSDPPEATRSALTAVTPAGVALSGSTGWKALTKAVDTAGGFYLTAIDTFAYATVSASLTSAIVTYSFAAFTAASHRIRVLHDTIGGGALIGHTTGTGPSIGVGGTTSQPGTSRMKVEFSLNAGLTFATMSDKAVPYDQIWTEIPIPDGSYVGTTVSGDANVQVKVTLTFSAGTENAIGKLNMIQVANAPAATQSAPLGFRYVVTEWDDVNKEESAWSAQSEVVSDSRSPSSTIANWNIVTIKLPPGMATPGKRQNNRTTHWRVYRQPEGSAKDMFDEYGLIAEIPVLKAPTFTVSAATNATPIAVTTTVSHGLATGARVVISGGLVNTAVNGAWTITVTGATTFTLDTSVGNGVYTASSAIANAASTEFVDQFDKLLTEVARPVLDCLITGEGDDRTFYPKAAAHPLYKSIDIFKECVLGVPVDDLSNVYFSPPGEYGKRPSLYRIPSRTTRNDSPTGVKTLDDIALIFFPDWTKKITNAPLVIDGRFDPSGATEASTSRGAAGPLAFDTFMMAQDSGTHWCAAADREGVYITNGNQFLPWTNNLIWSAQVNLGNDGDNLPYLARTIVTNNADKRRIEVRYVGAGATAINSRLDFFYGEGRAGQDSNFREDGQPRIFGPITIRDRGAVTALVLGQRQRFTSGDGTALAGRICWEDPDAFFGDDSHAVDGSGTVTRTLTTGDLPIAGLGQDGYLRSVALRTVRDVYHLITETISMEFSDGEKRTYAASQDPNAPSPTGVFAAGETFQYTLDDSGITEKAAILGIYVESKAWGGEAGALRAAVGAVAGTTSLPT